jgi:hypothetical protein
MKIDLVFITHNRLQYAKLALEGLLADPTEEFSLTIWDNASSDGMRDYLSSVEDPRISRKVFSQENLRLKGPINDLFSNSSADLVGIIPDDYLVTPGWTRTIAEAHADEPLFGAIFCWHLGRDCFDLTRAQHKIQKFDRHSVLRHPWSGGGAGLIKLRAIKECGLLTSSNTVGYWIRMAQKGYVNGFYYPLIHVENMDYPWSDHYAFSDRLQEGLEMSVTAADQGIRTLEEAKAWHQEILSNILDGPWDVRYYVGWRKKLRNAVQGIREICRLQS